MDTNTKQDLIERIKKSQIGDERKKQILILLEQDDFSYDIKQQIKGIIQEDIESGDDTIPFTAKDRREMANAKKQMSKELKAVDKELNKDMKFVKKEMNDIKT